MATTVPELTGWATVPLVGEIDLLTAPSVAARIQTASIGTVSGVVVDLSGVDFVGVTGLNAFVTAREELRGSRRDLRLWAPSPVMVRVLTICGLSDMVEQPGDRDQERSGR